MHDLDILNKRSLLVYISFPDKKNDINGNLKEFFSLSFSAGLKVVRVLVSKNKKFYAKYCIGIGKVLELEKIIKDDTTISLVVFNHVLSSGQERNLSNLLQCRVIDRHQLILNIFSQRAQTYEGKLQVKLAQLRYLNSRLIHEWNHLERQKGGISLRGGPGEMQLESDRRVLRKNISKILLSLKKIENQRQQNRRNRLKTGFPTVSLVGYTNAGKSTLFNIMTKSSVYASEKLFATLDSTFRKVSFSEECSVDIIFADTVGFIQNLPVSLISSFKATLQEITESALLVHVVDVSDEKLEQNIDVVRFILNSINTNNFVPTLLVMNKIDLLEKEVLPHIDRDSDGSPIRVWISAKEKIGISLLIRALNELLSSYTVRCELRIPIHDNLYQKLSQLQVVKKYWIEDDVNIRVKICLSSIRWNRLIKRNVSLLNYVVS